MKKVISLMCILTAALCCMSSCGSKENVAIDNPSADEIYVITREESSGTRSAFVELMGIVDENENDAIYDRAEVTDKTSVMITTINGNKKSIGYVSLGSLSSDVKAIKVDGVEATVENINSGNYKIARPFNIVYKEENLNELSKDFLSFILSDEGQDIIENEGYIRVKDGNAYKSSGASGTLSLSGSTSVAPVMDKLADEYKKLNTNVTIEIEQTGSSAGITAAIEGVCDLGMSSRDLKAEETEKLTSTSIATDGIAVIVNNANEIDNLSSDQIKKIFLGEINDWNSVK